MGNFKSTQLSTTFWVKLLPLLENALQLNSEAIKLTENLNPPQGPTHTLTPSSIQVKNSHGIHWGQSYRLKHTITLKSKDLAT